MKAANQSPPTCSPRLLQIAILQPPLSSLPHRQTKLAAGPCSPANHRRKTTLGKISATAFLRGMALLHPFPSYLGCAGPPGGRLDLQMIRIRARTPISRRTRGPCPPRADLLNLCHAIAIAINIPMVRCAPSTSFFSSKPHAKWCIVAPGESLPQTALRCHFCCATATRSSGATCSIQDHRL